MSMKVVAVSILLARIKTLISERVVLDGIYIKGEISNLTKHRTGHYYFSLKDEKAEMSCVMFASNASRMNFTLEEGMQVLVLASVNIYEPRGSLQLYVKSIRMFGLGALYQEFEARKKRLEAEGYFALAHKKAKPAFIENIGIITAKEGAALQDVLSTIQKRWPMARLTLYPSLTQGVMAPAALIKALKEADQNQHDALLLVRGGGSFEDLFCFNDVDLVHTIYDLQTYIVAGIGHEVDTTLAELAADQRVATPTAAATFVTVDQYEVWNKLEIERSRMIQRMQDLLATYQMRLVNLQSNPYFLDPLSWIQEKKIRLQHETDRLAHTLQNFLHKETSLLSAQTNRLYLHSPHSMLIGQQKILSQKESSLQEAMIRFYSDQKNKLTASILLLDAYSPLKVLARGYSIVESDQQVISSIDQVQLQDPVRIQMQDGCLQAIVLGKERKDA